MKKRVIDFFKKYWLPFWCLSSAVLFCGLYVSAKYELSSSTMKKVVASTSDQGKMFSSNLLVESGESAYVAKYFSTHEEDEQTHTIAPYDVDLYLWNYSLNNLSKWYPEDIEYTMKFTMTDSSGTTLNASNMGSRSVQLIKVTKTTTSTTDPDSGETTVTESISETELSTLDETNLTFTTSVQTLTHSPSSSSEDHYILRFSNDWDLDNDSELCVQTIATPDKSGNATKYRDISELSAVIGLRKNRSGISTGWEAYLAEQSIGKSILDCDGYNLVVTGSGQKTITIKWDSSKLSCNKYFYNNTVYSFGPNEIVHTDGTAQIVINADSGSSNNAYRNRYDVQFYKKGIDPSDWNFFKDDGSEISENVWLSVKVE